MNGWHRTMRNPFHRRLPLRCCTRLGISLCVPRIISGGVALGRPGVRCLSGTLGLSGSALPEEEEERGEYEKPNHSKGPKHDPNDRACGQPPSSPRTIPIPGTARTTTTRATRVRLLRVEGVPGFRPDLYWVRYLIRVDHAFVEGEGSRRLGLLVEDVIQDDDRRRCR